MYLDHYGFHEKPFDISTDPRFLWLGEKHKEAYSVLKYGVLENKGFLLLTGDVGAGKTTLINALVNSLGDDVVHAFIPDPGLEVREFYRYIANSFGCDESFKDKAEFLFIFRDFLHVAHENGKKVLLIVDEAQRLSNELLEEIRMLSNIELQYSKLLNIFFVGQAEFNTKLLDPDNRAVRQRITISNHIEPLTEKETGEYIRHRLKVAGSRLNIFSYVAVHEIYKYSGGYPRLINIVCDIALLTGYVRDKKKIGDDIIKESIESLNISDNQLSAETTGGVKKIISDNLTYSTSDDIDQPVPYVVAKKNHRRLLWFIFLIISASLLFLSAMYFIRNKSVGEFFLDKGSKVLSLFKKNEDLAVISEKKDISEQKMVLPYIAESETTSDSSENDETYLQKPVETRVVLDFDYNSNDFSEDSYKKMARVANTVKNNPGYTVVVTGYTDNLGNVSYNENLSLFRANTAKSFLIGKGIEKQNIRAQGLGSKNPVAPNDTMKGREQNRRVEIEIIKDVK